MKEHVTPWMLEAQLDETVRAIARLCVIHSRQPTEIEKEIVGYMREKLEAARHHEYESLKRKGMSDL